MDLVRGAGLVIVVMDHVDRVGNPKILTHCTLPLTGQRAVDRVITSLGVLDITASGLVLRELAPGITVEDISAATQPAVDVGPVATQPHTGGKNASHPCRHAHLHAKHNRPLDQKARSSPG